MSNEWSFGALVCLLLVEITTFLNNQFVVSRNYEVYKKECDHLKKEIDALIAEKDMLLIENHIFRKEQLSINAFVISADGIQVLPNDWKDKLAIK